MRNRTILPFVFVGLALVLSVFLVPVPAEAPINIRLYGITGDGATTPETLYPLNLTNGSPAFVMPLGHGDDGESVAFNPDDGLMYHLSVHHESSHHQSRNRRDADHHADGNAVDSFNQAPRLLAIVDPATGVLTPVGDTVDAFAAIAFAFDPGDPFVLPVGGFAIGAITPAVSEAVVQPEGWSDGLRVAVMVLVGMLGLAVIGLKRRSR